MKTFRLAVLVFAIVPSLVVTLAPPRRFNCGNPRVRPLQHQPRLHIHFSSGGADVDSPERDRSIILDWEILFNTSHAESLVALHALRQKLRPPKSDTIALGEVLQSGWQPWDEQDSIPTHRFRTFDIRRKLTTLLGRLCPKRPADTLLLLRLLLEEHAVTEPHKNTDELGEELARRTARNARPLTVGEVEENWDLIRERCLSDWLHEEWCLEEGVTCVPAGEERTVRSGGEGGTTMSQRQEDEERMLQKLDAALLSAQEEWLSRDFESYAALLEYDDPLVNQVVGDLLTASKRTTVLMSSSCLLGHPSLDWAAHALLARLRTKARSSQKKTKTTTAAAADTTGALNAAEEDTDHEDDTPPSLVRVQIVEDSHAAVRKELYEEEEGRGVRRVEYYGTDWLRLSLIGGLFLKDNSASSSSSSLTSSLTSSSGGGGEGVECNMAAWATRYNTWREREMAQFSSRVNLVTALQLSQPNSTSSAGVLPLEMDSSGLRNGLRMERL